MQRSECCEQLVEEQGDELTGEGTARRQQLLCAAPADQREHEEVADAFAGQDVPVVERGPAPPALLDDDLAACAEVPGTSYRTGGAGAHHLTEEEAAGHESGHRRDARRGRTGPAVVIGPPVESAASLGPVVLPSVT